MPLAADEEIARRFHRWRREHADEPELEVWFAAWRMAQWQTLRGSTDLGLGVAIQQMSDMLARLERMAKELREAEIDAEIEAQSVYWRTGELP